MKAKTPITETNLLEYGFEKRKYGSIVFFVKDEFAIVQNIKWLPCNIYTGVPLSTGLYVDTMEELEQLLIK
ncbi:MAG: hypothetical protein IKX44_07545 [Prevotella sp.]|nr:hypothetical protein [Prevotella sp.]